MTKIRRHFNMLTNNNMIDKGYSTHRYCTARTHFSALNNYTINVLIISNYIQSGPDVAAAVKKDFSEAFFREAQKTHTAQPSVEPWQ